MHISGTIIELIKIQQAYWKAYTLTDSEGGGRDVPPPKKKKEERERERRGSVSSPQIIKVPANLCFPCCCLIINYLD